VLLRGDNIVIVIIDYALWDHGSYESLLFFAFRWSLQRYGLLVNT